MREKQGTGEELGQLVIGARDRLELDLEGNDKLAWGCL